MVKYQRNKIAHFILLMMSKICAHNFQFLALFSGRRRCN